MQYTTIHLQQNATEPIVVDDQPDPTFFDNVDNSNSNSTNSTETAEELTTINSSISSSPLDAYLWDMVVYYSIQWLQVIVPIVAFSIQASTVWNGKVLNTANAVAVFGPLITHIIWWLTLAITATLMFFLGDTWVEFWFLVFADWGLYGSFGLIGQNLIFLIVGIAAGDTDTANSIQTDLWVGLALYSVFQGGYIFLMYWLRDATKAYFLAWDGSWEGQNDSSSNSRDEVGSEEVGSDDDKSDKNEAGTKVKIDDEGNITFPDEDPVNIEEDFFIL